MNVLYRIASLCLVAMACGKPMPQAQGNQSLVPGVFIPAAAFKNLQDRANANSGMNNQPATSNQGYQTTNVNRQPSYQPAVNSNYQPVNTNQPQYATMAYQPNAQPAQAVRNSNNQPTMTNQAQPLIADRVNQPTSNQPMVLTNQPNQPQQNQPIIYVQQPQRTNQPTILVTQPQQPTYVSQQPNRLVLQNTSGGQPSSVLIANPSNPQNANTGNYYTLIPLNGQNSNTNTGSYLIPVQSSNSNPIVLSNGK